MFLSPREGFFINRPVDIFNVFFFILTISYYKKIKREEHDGVLKNLGTV